MEKAKRRAGRRIQFKPIAPGLLKQGMRALHICANECAEISIRSIDVARRGKMDDGFGPMRTQNRGHLIRIANIRLRENVALIPFQ
jgi:hypothetical protein